MDLHFAIELKASGIESEVADLLLKYGMEKKTVVTSFNAEYIRKIKEYASSLRVGFLTKSIDKDVTDMLIEMGADEICPYGAELTREDVARLHRIGFNVRAWGISDESVMKRVFDIGADGMTVNFPDKLTEYVNEQRK